MKLIYVSMLLLLTGCSVDPVLRPYPVETIISVPCIEEKDVPAKPAYTPDSELLDAVKIDAKGRIVSGEYEFVYYLYFDRDVRQDYEERLEAVLKACVKK